MTRFVEVVAACMRLALVAAFGWALLLSAIPVPAQTVVDQWKKELPVPTGFVNDFASVIDASSKARMETMSRNFRDRTEIDIAVVTLESLNGRPIEDVALALGREWGIGAGAEKNGLLILLSIGDRQSRIETSRKLDDEITDGTAGEILRQSRPQFIRGEYGDGLRLALETVLATIATKRGISIEGIDNERAYGKRPAAGQSGGSTLVSKVFTLFILIAFILFIVRASGRGGGGGRGGRGGGRRDDSSWVLPFIVGSSFGGGGSGGSSGGWSGGGGGSDWGGFGGGGDFGGGGASDSW